MSVIIFLKSFFLLYNIIYLIVICCRAIGGDVTTDADFLIFEGNRYSRKGFLYKNFTLNSIVSLELFLTFLLPSLLKACFQLVRISKAKFIILI